MTLNDIVIIYEDSLNADAWEKFISSLKEKEAEKQEAEPNKRVSEEAEVVASTEKMAFPLPDVPSIAVLPFVNMSEDPKQEFLCDGITENVISVLSKVPRLFVISRQSTFFYKGKPVKVNQVSEELGVQYVLEGSVHRSGDRIRINAQLIDALTGHHLWAERYDRDLKDIFALQDEITIKILTGVQVKLEGGDVSGAEKYAEKYYSGKQGLDCYLKLMQGMGYFARLNIEDNNLARRIVEEAIAMYPENPWGYVCLGWIYFYDYMLGNTKSPRETIEKATELAKKTLAMDGSIGDAHGLLGWLYICKREYDKAIAEGERDVALNPGDRGALHCYACFLTFAGRPKEAILLFEKAIRLSPFGPAATYVNFGHALRMTGRFDEAVSAYKKAIQIAPNRADNHFHLTAAYSMMGLEKEAHAEAAEVLRRYPNFSLDFYAKGPGMLLYKEQSERDKVLDAMRKAGLK
jgi:adenylate cyclase